jgi:hypothetical protein
MGDCGVYDPFVQPDQAEAVAAITKYLADVEAAEKADNEDEWEALYPEDLEVRVNGQLWCLELGEDGWEACPAHDSPERPGSIEIDGTDGEPRTIGGPDLTPEEIVGLLLAAGRTP